MKNSMNKILGIFLYVLASLLLIYSIWALTNSMSYIGEMIDAGQLTFAGNEYDIMNFYMGNCAQYFVFAVLLAVSGFMIGRGTGVVADAENPPVQKQFSEEDAELDEWFEK